MSDRQQKTASVGTGGGTTAASAGTASLLAPILPQNGGIVNSVPVMRIDTALEGCTVVVWCAMDAMQGLVRELLRRGLIADDERLIEAILTVWAQVGQATYLTADDRKAWPEQEVEA